MVRAETDKWVAEFQDAIQQVDEISKARAALLETGAINVTVTNGDHAEGGWKPAVDNGPPADYTGKQAAVASLTPGMHRLSVSGVVNGNRRTAEQVVTVAAGKATDVPFTL